MARRRPPRRPDDAPPRSEAEWEAEFRRMDVVTDRFGELLETLIDDPDRHEKIAREMGWFQDEDGDGPAFDPESAGDDFDDGGDDDADATDDETSFDETSLSDPFADDDPRDRADRLAVPAYAAAMDLSHRVMDVLKDRLGGSADDGVEVDGESAGELVGRAMIGVQIATANLIGGHAMGYEDFVLGANIVNCKRALAGAVDGRAAWQTVRDRGLVPAPVADDLIAGHDEVIRMIEGRIADLRGRVHW